MIEDAGKPSEAEFSGLVLPETNVSERPDLPSIVRNNQMAVVHTYSSIVPRWGCMPECQVRYVIRIRLKSRGK